MILPQLVWGRGTAAGGSGGGDGADPSTILRIVPLPEQSSTRTRQAARRTFRLVSVADGALAA